MVQIGKKKFVQSHAEKKITNRVCPKKKIRSKEKITFGGSSKKNSFAEIPPRPPPQMIYGRPLMSLTYNIMLDCSLFISWNKHRLAIAVGQVKKNEVNVLQNGPSVSDTSASFFLIWYILTEGCNTDNEPNPICFSCLILFDLPRPPWHTNSCKPRFNSDVVERF